MKKKNRYIRTLAALVALTLLCVSFAGCGNSANSDPGDDGRLSVVCTVFPQYDFIRNIVGDRADVSLLIPPGTEVHGYEPVLSDVAAIADSDLLVCVSKVSESWVEDALSSMGSKAPLCCELVSGVQTVEEELTEGMEPDEDEAEEDDDDWDI